MFRITLTLLLCTLGGVGSCEEMLPGTCYSKVEVSHSGGRDYTYIGTGSFLTDRMVLSCAHNLRPDPGHQVEQISIVDENGHTYTDVTVLRVDSDKDLSLLRVDDEELKPHGLIPFIRSDNWYQGDVKSYGYWGSKSRYHSSRGRTTGKFFGSMGGDTQRTMFGHTGKVYQGMSGGPALSQSGLLIGVNVGHQDGVSYTVGLPIISEFLSP